MEEINDPSMPLTATRMRTVVMLLVSSCLSIAIGLAMLITALVPASVAAPSRMQSAPCSIAAVWPESHISGATCPLAKSLSKCCTRLLVG
jgi:hypothetical protein